MSSGQGIWESTAHQAGCCCQTEESVLGQSKRKEVKKGHSEIVPASCSWGVGRAAVDDRRVLSSKTGCYLGQLMAGCDQEE